MNQINPDYVAFGSRAAMQAEFGTPDYYEGKYLVQPIGAAEFDAEGFKSIREARAYAKEVAAYFGVKVHAY